MIHIVTLGVNVTAENRLFVGGGVGEGDVGELQHLLFQIY